MTPQPQRPVVVVGGSSRHLTDPTLFRQACQALGRELVRGGYKVRAGSLRDSTADYWIAKAVYKESRELLEFYRPTFDESDTDSRRTEFEGVSFIKGAERWDKTYELMLAGAQGLLILGGASHTGMLWNEANELEQFARVAVPAFGGAAEQYFQELRDQYREAMHTSHNWSSFERWNPRDSAVIWVSVLKRLMDAPQTTAARQAATQDNAGSVVNMSGAVPASVTPGGSIPSQTPPQPPTGVAVTLEDKPPPTDLLGRQPLAESLAAMFASPHQPTPLTVAILGDWGAGKTTLMEMVKQSLRDDASGVEFFHAHYSAWHYEHVANTFAGLANEVVAGVSKGVEWHRWPQVVVRFAAAEHGWNLVWALFQLLGATAGAALAVKWAVEAASDPDSAVAKAILSAATGTGAIYFFISLVQQVRSLLGTPLADRLSTYFRLPEYGQHLGLVPVLQRQLRHLCRFALGSSGRRLLVVIEDLDRCGAKCINETLDAVRLIVDLPGVIVVLLIDHRIAFKAVEERFSPLADDARSSKVIARDFLGKIVQLPIVLAPPESLHKFVTERLFAVTGGPQAPRPVQPPVAPKVAPAAPLVAEGDPLPPPDRPADPIEVAPPAPRQLKPKSAASTVIEQAMNHSPEEATEFERLASAFRLTNPRRLTRLRNSYRLATLLVFQHFQGQNKVADFSWQRTLQTLFWFEYLSEVAPDQRERDLQPESALLKSVPRVDTNSAEQMVQFLVLPHSA